jgi:hypothetical protein
MWGYEGDLEMDGKGIGGYGGDVEMDDAKGERVLLPHISSVSAYSLHVSSLREFGRDFNQEGVNVSTFARSFNKTE